MKLSRSLLAVSAVLALTACSSSGGGAAGGGAGGGGGGGGGSATAAAYDAAHKSVLDLAPTTQRISGTASYAGEMAILAPGSRPADGRVTNDDNTVIADLTMDVNFDDGATNPVTARASGFRGKIGGAEITASGEITTAAFIADGGDAALNAVNTSTSSAPVVGDLTSTSVIATMRGNVTGSAGGESLTGRMDAALLGTVVGPIGAVGGGGNATGIHGPVNVVVTPDGGTAETTGGTFYVNRD